MPNEDAGRKEVAISLSALVDEGIGPDQVADVVAKALAGLTEHVHSVSDLAVRTVPRHLPTGTDGGYETRLWEKVTCNLRDPEGELENPERDLAKAGEELAAVHAHINELTAKVERLTKTIGR